jgi:hypothetical protein
MDIYELSDYEEAMNLKKFNEKIKKEMEKNKKPKSKPQNIFVNFKKK